MSNTVTLGDVGMMDDGSLSIVTSTGISPISIGAASNTVYVGNGSSTITLGVSEEDILDTWEMNRVTADHKLQENEFQKLKETVPTYADEIKENLTKGVARDIIKKMTFTKKHDKDADVHHFIGRVWVFTEDELKKLIRDARGS